MENPSDVSGESQIIKKQLSYSEIEQVSRAFVASGMFGRDVDKISKAITKIMAGQELGLAPFASMRAVHVIEGNATLSANTMAGMVKSSGRYDYEVVKKEIDECVIDFYEIRKGKRVKLGTEKFDEAEAKAAQLLNKQNWQKYPKAMMFARCISNGVRTYCPDVFSGMLVYTPDELNARVSDSGDVIDMDGEGNVTNAPEKPAAPKSKKETEAVDADIDQSPPADDVPVTDISNEGTEDLQNQRQFLSVLHPNAIFCTYPTCHPDITDPNEPAEASGPDEPEEEVEAPAVVDQEFMDTAWEMYESLPLKASYRMRWLKEVTGVITRNSIKSDENWRSLMDRAGAVLSGDEEIAAENRTDTGDQEKIV